MKITRDVPDPGLHRVQRDLSPKRGDSGQSNSINSKNNRLMDQQLQQSISSRLQMERSLGDAMSIAQVSRSMVQKAIILSSQLQSIASAALSSGHVDVAAVKETVAQISPQMAEQGEVLSVPSGSFGQLTGASVEEVSVAGEFRSLEELGLSMERGEVPALEVFTDLDKSLGGKTEVIGKIIAGLEEVFADMAGDYSSFNNTSAQGAAADVAASVVSAPEGALSAQGNVSPEIAAILLGS